MKKLLISFAFLGLFSFVNPLNVSATEPCVTVTIHCNDGSSHYAVCCDGEDFEFWRDYYCGADTN